MAEKQLQIPDLGNVLERVDEDPFGGLEEFGAAFETVRKGDRLMRREGMAAAHQAYLKIVNDDDEWASFQKRAERKGINYKPRKNPRLMYALLVALPGVKYPRIDVYAGGLQVLIEEGVQPTDVPAEIKKRGGIDALFDKAKEAENKIDARVKNELRVVEKLMRAAIENGSTWLFEECSEELLKQAIATRNFLLGIDNLGVMVDGPTRSKAVAIDPK